MVFQGKQIEKSKEKRIDNSEKAIQYAFEEDWKVFGSFGITAPIKKQIVSRKNLVTRLMRKSIVVLG